VRGGWKELEVNRYGFISLFFIRENTDCFSFGKKTGRGKYRIPVLSIVDFHFFFS
jgi:hypothetical protein